MNRSSFLFVVMTLVGCDVSEPDKGLDTSLPGDWTTTSTPTPTGGSTSNSSTTDTGSGVTTTTGGGSTTGVTTGGSTTIDTSTTGPVTTGTSTLTGTGTGVGSTTLPTIYSHYGLDSGDDYWEYYDDYDDYDDTGGTTWTTSVWGTTGTSTSVGTGTGTATFTFTFTSVPGGPSTVGPPVGTTTTSTTTSTGTMTVPLAADWEEACTEHIVDGVETCFAFIPETSADGRTFAVIHYLSTVPMYGYQFDLVDGTYNGTTAEVAGGFWAIAMETTLLGVSLTLDAIEPGTGVLLEAGFEEVSTSTRITPLIVGDGPEYLEASSVVLGGGLLWD